MAKTLPAMQEPQEAQVLSERLSASFFVNTCGQEKIVLNFFFFTSYMGFLGGSVAKNLPANIGDMDSIVVLRSCSGGGNGNPL